MDGPGGFRDLFYPIYHNHFTHQELKELIAFYKTPLGQKVLKELPLLTQEGMEAGSRWGTSLGPAIQERLLDRFRKEGLLK